MGQQQSSARCAVCGGNQNKRDVWTVNGVCSRCTSRRLSLDSKQFFDSDTATVTPSIETASTITVTTMRPPPDSDRPRRPVRPRTAGAEDRPSNSRKTTNFSRDSARAVLEKRRRLFSDGTVVDPWGPPSYTERGYYVSM
ncbi:hypothetical protein L218DRAFT_1078328 [Marasmius fiardii PR-910]|nr:hypothetical protein L218DRAFT_1078328 [Marasmius fiardii PR-910]